MLPVQWFGRIGLLRDEFHRCEPWGHGEHRREWDDHSRLVDSGKLPAGLVRWNARKRAGPMRNHGFQRIFEAPDSGRSSLDVRGRSYDIGGGGHAHGSYCLVLCECPDKLGGSTYSERLLNTWKRKFQTLQSDAKSAGVNWAYCKLESRAIVQRSNSRDSRSRPLDVYTPELPGLSSNFFSPRASRNRRIANSEPWTRYRRHRRLGS